jgi:hypothetical protein
MMAAMLAVFKVRATLPFLILPTLKGALVKATKFPIALPAAALGIKALVMPGLNLPSNTSIVNLMEQELDMLNPLNAVKAITALAAAGSEVAESLMNGEPPMELVMKSLLNLNITESMAAEPQVCGSS